MTSCHDTVAATAHPAVLMTSPAATLPTNTATALAPVDAGAFLDRAAAFIRSWGARDEPMTMSHVLALWRAAERDLDMATPGSDSWIEASGRFLAARAEYQRMFAHAAASAESLRRMG
jgi:hypothetical protein